jgi:hypothetical protein
MNINKLHMLIIALLLFPVFYSKIIYARTNISSSWERIDCVDQTYERFSKEKNQPSRDQCIEYCACLFSYDEKTEAPFTFNNITEEHIDNCKAKTLKIE